MQRNNRNFNRRIVKKSYSSIIREPESVKTEDDGVTEPVRVSSISLKHKTNYQTWEFKYFPYLEHIYAIFMNGASKLYPNLDELDEYTQTKFKKRLFKLLYDRSSGKIDDNIKSVNEREYFNFLIKSNFDIINE